MLRCLKLSVFPTVLIFVFGLMFSFSVSPEKTTTPAKPKSAMAKEKGGLLDGAKYIGTITVKDQKKSGAEMIEFEKGKIISTTFLPYGFNTTDYSGKKQKDGNWRFVWD